MFIHILNLQVISVKYFIKKPMDEKLLHFVLPVPLILFSFSKADEKREKVFHRETQIFAWWQYHSFTPLREILSSFRGTKVAICDLLLKLLFFFIISNF